MNRPYPPEPPFGPHAAPMPYPYGAGQASSAPPHPAYAHAPHPGWQHAPAPSQPWAAHPAQAWWWGQGMPTYSAPYAPHHWPQPEPVHSEPPQAARRSMETEREQLSAIEEIRAGLRECREAIRELAEQRSRRRYF